MVEQHGAGPRQAEEAQRRKVGVVAFLVGLVAGLAFFAFFPGLPHVIDWGAILVSLGVGGVARWAAQSRTAQRTRKIQRM